MISVRRVIVIILVVAAILFGLYLRVQWVMFGTPARTLENMISAESGREVMRCYSGRSLSMMRRIRCGREPDHFRFSAVTGGAGVEIVSEERSGPVALLCVRIGDAPPYKIRFVREGIGWKFDISDKLSAAFKGTEK